MHTVRVVSFCPPSPGEQMETPVQAVFRGHVMTPVQGTETALNDEFCPPSICAEGSRPARATSNCSACSAPIHWELRPLSALPSSTLRSHEGVRVFQRWKIASMPPLTCITAVAQEASTVIEKQDGECTQCPRGERPRDQRLRARLRDGQAVEGVCGRQAPGRRAKASPALFDGGRCARGRSEAALDAAFETWWAEHLAQKARRSLVRKIKRK